MPSPSSSFKSAIVVPTLGQRPQLLEECLRSIRSQTPRPQIILVYSGADPVLLDRISHLVDKVLNQNADGLSSAIMAGISEVDSGVEFVSWLGDDDSFRLGGLAELERCLARDSSAGFAFGTCSYIDGDGREFFQLRASRLSMFKTRWFTNSIAQPASLIRLSSLLSVGGLSLRLKYAMDLDLWLRLGSVSKPAWTPMVVADYRWHVGSLSAGDERASLLEGLQVRRDFGHRLQLLVASCYSGFGILRLRFGLSLISKMASLAPPKRGKHPVD